MNYFFDGDFTPFNKNNIFIRNINNKYKLVSFKVKENFVGEAKYFPADSKE
jgi:hypothetical protein